MPSDCQEEESVDTALTTRRHVGPFPYRERERKSPWRIKEREVEEGEGRRGGRETSPTKYPSLERASACKTGVAGSEANDRTVGPNTGASTPWNSSSFLLFKPLLSSNNHHHHHHGGVVQLLGETADTNLWKGSSWRVTGGSDPPFRYHSLRRKLESSLTYSLPTIENYHIDQPR